MERCKRRRAPPGKYFGLILACLTLVGILVVDVGCNKYADDFTRLNVTMDDITDRMESAKPPVESVLNDLDRTPREADPIIPREPPKPASEAPAAPPVESVLKDISPIIPGVAAPKAAEPPAPLPIPALPPPSPFTQAPSPLPTLKPGQLAVPLVMSADIKGTATGVVVTLGVDYQAHITGAPSVKVTRMILKVNGETWADSGPLAVSDFTNVVAKQVAPGQTYTAQVTISTSDGSNNVATSSLAIPKP
jgi:hypothetical protein